MDREVIGLRAHRASLAHPQGTGGAQCPVSREGALETINGLGDRPQTR